MIPEIGPNPGQYPKQPHVFGIHRRMYELLGERVAEHLGTPVLPVKRQEQLGDAFQRVSRSQGDDPNPHRPDVIARLFGGMYRQLVAFGLLPIRPAQSIDDAMIAESTATATAVNRFSIQSRKYWFAIDGALRGLAQRPDGLGARLEASADATSMMSMLDEAGVKLPERPDGMFIIGRHPIASTRSYDPNISRFHLAGQYSGNLLLLRDGFYPTFDNDGLAKEELPEWRPTTNGSFYFDEAYRQHRIPSDHALVLPNRPVIVELAQSLYQLNQGQLLPLEQVFSDEIYTRKFETSLSDLSRVENGVLTLGRENDNAFVLKTQRVSRHHAQIIHQGGRFSILDRDSTNGTLIHRDGVAHPIFVGKSRPAVLRPGDRIQLGETYLTFNPPNLSA